MGTFCSLKPESGCITVELGKIILRSHGAQERMEAVRQMYRLVFVPLLSLFLYTVPELCLALSCSHLKLSTSACGVGIILTPLPPGKLRCREFKGIWCLPSAGVEESWSPDL